MPDPVIPSSVPLRHSNESLLRQSRELTRRGQLLRAASAELSSHSQKILRHAVAVYARATEARQIRPRKIG